MTGVPTPPSPPVPIAPGAWKHTEHPTPSALTRRSQASRAHREGQRGTGRELTPRHHQRVVRSLSRSRSSRGDRRPRHPAGGRGEFKGTTKVGASGVAACFSPAWRFVSLSSLLTFSCLDPVWGGSSSRRGVYSPGSRRHHPCAEPSFAHPRNLLHLHVESSTIVHLYCKLRASPAEAGRACSEALVPASRVAAPFPFF